METRGVKVAVDYLNSFYPIALVPEELKKRAGCTIMVDTLARKLRENTNRQDPEKGRVVAEIFLNDNDLRVVRYKGNPGFQFAPRKKATAMIGCWPMSRGTKPPAVFFFETLQTPGAFSPYYTSLEVMRQDALAALLAAVYFTGSHEKPIRLVSRKRYLVVKRIVVGALALFMLSMGLIFWSLSERIEIENKSLTTQK